MVGGGGEVTRHLGGKTGADLVREAPHGTRLRRPIPLDVVLARVHRLELWTAEARLHLNFQAPQRVPTT